MLYSSPNDLEYDAAGNTEIDERGYEYEYDYENRIVKITRDPSSTVVAEFAYDALGRRIKKRDAIADTNNIYYYNDKWQVLCEYDGSGSFEHWFAYGNYIDEVLMVSETFFPTSTTLHFYVHDHLYSPVALVKRQFLAVTERYEYDAYGKATIRDAQYAIRDTSLYNNPYLFTGRRVDILDNGSLKIMYYRHRYYGTYTGRFFTHDPLSYVDGMSLYEYCGSEPVSHLDAVGAKKDEVGPPPEDQPGLPSPIPPGDWIRIILKGKNVFGKQNICGWIILKSLTNLKVDLTWKDLIPFGCKAFKMSNEDIVKEIMEEAKKAISVGKKGGGLVLGCKKGYCCCNKAKFHGDYHVTVQLEKIRMLIFCEISGTISTDVEFEGKVGGCTKK